jgi:hypothetical protein
MNHVFPAVASRSVVPTAQTFGLWDWVLPSPVRPLAQSYEFSQTYRLDPTGTMPRLPFLA